MKPIEAECGAYLEWCEYVKRMTAATIITKRKALDRFLRVNPSLESLTTLTNFEFNQWRASLAKQGKAGKTINNYADHVVCCIRWLQTHQKLAIALDIPTLERAQEEDPEIVVYSRQEIAKALKHCIGPREAVLLSLVVQSGLRLNEVATLKVESLDGLAVEVVGKGRKRRRTFMRQDTRKKLDIWLNINGIVEGWVFPSPLKYNSHITTQHIRMVLKGPFERAGIKKRAHPHALRHTWFTFMLDNGAPLMDTAIMGGHSDPRTTRRYYHASPQRHQAIHKAFMPDEKDLKRPETGKIVENRGVE